MKKVIVLYAFLSLFAATLSSAQVTDDVYFDPSKDRPQTQRQVASRDKYDVAEQDGYRDAQSGYGHEDDYDYYNDYDYYYTSRIRRFHRPYYGFNFFDPIYVDTWHYDPFLAPGVTVLIYDDFYSNRAFSRWNRWNAWGPGLNVGISLGRNNWNRWNSWDPWGWNSWNGLNSWNNWGWNSWNSFNRFGGWNSWGFGNPYWFSGSAFAFPPTWGNGFVYNTIVNINTDQNTHFGPRSGGSATGPAPGARPGRGPGVIDNSPGAAPRSINTAGGRLPETGRVRTPAVTGANGEISNPGERTAPMDSRESGRYFDRYPRNTETTNPDARIPANTRTPAAERPAPANTPGARTFPAYDPNRNNTYDRPRNMDSGTRTAPSTTPAPRSTPTTQTPRVYTPQTRTTERTGTSYDRPRTPPSSNSGNNGFSQPRSMDSGFSSPRSSSPSGGSINSAPRSGGSSSGSSSSSGGRTRN